MHCKKSFSINFDFVYFFHLILIFFFPEQSQQNFTIECVFIILNNLQQIIPSFFRSFSLSDTLKNPILKFTSKSAKLLPTIIHSHFFFFLVLHEKAPFILVIHHFIDQQQQQQLKFFTSIQIRLIKLNCYMNNNGSSSSSKKKLSKKN